MPDDLKNTRGMVIPFGKHKGKPVEILQDDATYREWLMAQPWFAERYQPIYQVIVNNFGEPTDTPEHNAMQAKFLDDALCLALLRLLFRASPIMDTTEQNIRVLTRNFEEGGWDVIINKEDFYFGEWDLRTPGAAVELKPDLGDDYPAVLRQLKSRTKLSGFVYRVLVVDRFDAVGANLDQVRSIFKQSGFRLVLLSEIEEMLT